LPLLETAQELTFARYFEVGSKALFFELLYYIAQHFRDVEGIRSEMVFKRRKRPASRPF
jgi:hypothetical protein